MIEGTASSNSNAFEKLFQFATVGIIVINKGGQIERINRHAEKLFGYGDNELIDESLEQLLPETLKRKHVHLRDGFMKEPKTRAMGKGLTLFGCRKDGTEFPVEISLSHYISGDQMKAVAFISDITHRRITEEKLENLTRELEEKVRVRTMELEEALKDANELNEMKSTFISMASHEFRTPLTVLLSNLSMIERYIDLDRVDETPKHFERIKGAIDRLTYILNDFLSIDKVEVGIMKPRIRSFNFKGFTERIIEELDGMLKEGQEIRYTHEGACELQMDEEMLHNIFHNLLSNAIKYSDKQIDVTTHISDSQIKITVVDQGIGISEEDQKHIFTKFYRAGNVNIIQGTGLGLNIVQRYVELLEGVLVLESTLNVGTSVTVTFDKQSE